MAPLPPLDTDLFRILNVHAANPFFDAAFPVLTSLHQQPWLLAIGVIGAALTVWKGSARARLWVAALVLAVGISDVVCSRAVKRFIERERPCQAAARGVVSPAGFTIRVVEPQRCPGSRSFPSNHAANTMAICVVGCLLTRRRTRWAWTLLPLVIGYTRIYLGYHYPTDVAGGWLVGAASAAMVLAILRPVLLRTNGPGSGSADTAAPGALPPADARPRRGA